MDRSEQLRGVPLCGGEDFYILLFAYAFDDEDVRVVDMACGEELPQEVRDAIFDENLDLPGKAKRERLRVSECKGGGTAEAWRRGADRGQGRRS